MRGQNSLNFRWERSVYYGTHGQRTVTDGSILIHLGGESYQYTINDNGTSNEYSYIETFDPNQGYWKVKEIKIISRRFINAEYYNGKVYIVNGYTSGIGVRNELEIYDVANNTLNYGEPIPTPRRSAGSAQLNGKIYIVGGSDNSQFFNILSIYNISTNTWTTGTSMPVAMETEMVAYNGKLYVLGGYNGNVHNEVFEYDPSTDSWSQIATMPEPTSAHKLAAYQGKIISLGDFSDLNRVQIFDIASGNWVIPETNLIGRRHASTAILNNRLYYIAGNSKLDGSYQFYRIVQSIDLNDVITKVGDIGENIKNFKLETNYPNPFNPTTTISYVISSNTETATNEILVQLKVYDALGREVATLVNVKQTPGKYSVQFNASNLPSGVYFYTLRAGNFVQTKKMILMK